MEKRLINSGGSKFLSLSDLRSLVESCSKGESPKYTLRIKQVRSGCNRLPNQRKTLVGLGLNRIGSFVERGLTQDLEGMIRRVHHLVSFEIV